MYSTLIILLVLILLPLLLIFGWYIYYTNIKTKLTELHVKVNDSYTISELQYLLVEVDSYSKRCKFNSSAWIMKVKLSNKIVKKLKELHKLK